MIQNVIVLTGMTILAAGIAASVGIVRKKHGWRDLSAWWNGEGIVVFVLTWFVLGIILFTRGCLKNL